MILQIEVTQAHIDGGKQHNCSYCPVALAIKDKLHSHAVIGVGHSIVAKLIGGEYEFIGHLPMSARKFVREFDRLAPVQPFVFELPIEPAYEYLVKVNHAQGK